ASLVASVRRAAALAQAGGAPLLPFWRISLLNPVCHSAGVPRFGPSAAGPRTARSRNRRPQGWAGARRMSSAGPMGRELWARWASLICRGTGGMPPALATSPRRRAARAAGFTHFSRLAGQPPGVGQRPAQQELDLGVGAAQLVSGPPGQGV